MPDLLQPQRTAAQSHSGIVSTIFKIIFNTLESFNNKRFFYSEMKQYQC